MVFAPSGRTSRRSLLGQPILACLVTFEAGGRQTPMLWRIAGPPRRFEPYSRETGMDRAPRLGTASCAYTLSRTTTGSAGCRSPRSLARIMAFGRSTSYGLRVRAKGPCSAGRGRSPECPAIEPGASPMSSLVTLMNAFRTPPPATRAGRAGEGMVSPGSGIGIPRHPPRRVRGGMGPRRYFYGT
jgi:hypothetical protein